MFTESYAYGIMCVANRTPGYFFSNRCLNARSRRLLPVYHYDRPLRMLLHHLVSTFGFCRRLERFHHVSAHPRKH
jgi:hypothetical protein